MPIILTNLYIYVNFLYLTLLRLIPKLNYKNKIEKKQEVSEHFDKNKKYNFSTGIFVLDEATKCERIL